MSFTEDIAKLSDQVRKRVDQVAGEQATKMSLIVPFLSALGYDVYAPAEVIPEYVADFATKKSGQFEKVDYALSINGTIVMIVEAKSREQKAESHDGQLKRYFNGLTSTKVAVVTNGIEYRFFTDLRDKNVMDEEPFFTFNVLKYDSKDVENLNFFHRDNFNVEAIGRQAEEMVYVKAMTKLVGELLRSPSEELIYLLVSQLGIEGGRRITRSIIEKFKPIVKKSIQNSLVELMTRSLNQEVSQPTEASKDSKQIESSDVNNGEEEQDTQESKVVTTDEELEAFEKIQAIVKTSSAYNLEVNYKDFISYFGVHVGKPRWWFVRLYLTPDKKSFITRLPAHEVQSLAPGFEIQEVPTSVGETASRVVISSLSDLDRLTPLILKCYEVEALKRCA